MCRHLKSDPSLAFDYLSCISGVDYLHTDEKKAAKSEWQPHTEVVYHLYSMKHKHSLVLKVMLPRWQGPGLNELPEVPSVAGVWSTADWHNGNSAMIGKSYNGTLPIAAASTGVEGLKAIVPISAPVSASRIFTLTVLPGYVVPTSVT